jgi:type 1 glutamine amidotransferase
MKRALAAALGVLALGMATADHLAGSQPAPLRVFLRGGPKTHGPAGDGHHDGPTFVKEWMPLLQSRGAKVDGALTFPTADQLAATDVLVMFCANGGDIAPTDRPAFDAFLSRGGGIVALHDAVLSREPQWFKTVIGGAWENRVAKYYEGENTYYYVNTEHPITKGASNFAIDDEVYWDLHLMPDINILQATMQPARQGSGRGAAPDTQAAPGIGKLIPQMWTYEHTMPGGQPYRAVVSILGHNFSTFSSPHVRAIFLRAIAWAGRRDVDSLATADEVAALK